MEEGELARKAGMRPRATFVADGWGIALFRQAASGSGHDQSGTGEGRMLHGRDPRSPRPWAITRGTHPSGSAAWNVRLHIDPAMAPTGS
jgi:hypothetical protein